MHVKIILKIHSQTKIDGHIPSGLSMSPISSSKPIKRGKDCIRRFGESLR